MEFPLCWNCTSKLSELTSCKRFLNTLTKQYSIYYIIKQWNKHVADTGLYDLPHTDAFDVNIPYLFIASFRHLLQYLCPHLVRTGSLKGSWQIKQWYSSNTVETKSYSYPDGTLTGCWTSAIFSRCFWLKSHAIFAARIRHGGTTIIDPWQLLDFYLSEMLYNSSRW